MIFKLKYTQGLGIILLLFILLYCTLCFFNQFAADDFYFLKAQQTLGTIKTMKQSYSTFSGRWMSYSATGFFLNFSNSPYFLFIFGLIVYFLITFAVYQLLNKLLLMNNIEVNIAHKIYLSICLLASNFFCLNNPGEIWFWYTSVCSYLLSLTALIGLIAIILSTKRGALQFILTLILSTFIGGASESFAICSIYILIILVVFAYKLKLSINKNYLTLALVALISSFALEILAPGNWLRIKMLPPAGSMQQTFSPLKAWIKISLLTARQIIWPGILFLIPFFILGNSLKEKTKADGIFKILKKPYWLAFIALNSFILLLPASLILSETPPTRALSQFIFFVNSMAAIYFFLLGMYMYVSDKKLLYLKFLSLLAAFFYLSIVIFSEGKEAMEYAQDCQSRIQLLRSQNKETTVPLELNNLKKCNFLYSAEITKDTSHYLNKQLQNYFGLKSAIYLKWQSDKNK